MKWSQWKIGACVAALTGLCQAGVALAAADSIQLKGVLVLFTVNVATNLGLYLKQHPPETIPPE